MEILESEIQDKKTHEELSPIDSHYFVYAKKEYVEKNKEELTILGHLIQPLSIVTGFDPQEEVKLFKKSPP